VFISGEIVARIIVYHIQKDAKKVKRKKSDEKSDEKSK